MRRIMILLSLVSAPVFGCDAKSTMAEVMYSEARGVSAEEMVMVGHALKNWWQKSKHDICHVARTGFTQKTIPSSVKGIYHALADGILKGSIADPTQGANHFNEGRRPAYKGAIRRHTPHFVFYYADVPA